MHLYNPNGNFAVFECAELDLKFNEQNLRIIVIYRPPPSRKNELTQGMFLDDFPIILDELAQSNANFLLAGDFNIHVDSLNPESIKFADLLETADLVQHVRGETHMSGHTLDLVITRVGSQLVKEIQVDTFLSDHAAISFTCCLKKRHVPIKKVTYRKLRDINLDTFSEEIHNSLSTLPTVDDVSQQVDEYNTKVQRILNIHAPEKCKKHHSPQQYPLGTLITSDCTSRP